MDRLFAVGAPFNRKFIKEKLRIVYKTTENSKTCEMKNRSRVERKKKNLKTLATLSCCQFNITQVTGNLHHHRRVFFFSFLSTRLERSVHAHTPPHTHTLTTLTLR